MTDVVEHVARALHPRIWEYWDRMGISSGRFREKFLREAEKAVRAAKEFEVELDAHAHSASEPVKAVEAAE